MKSYKTPSRNCPGCCKKNGKIDSTGSSVVNKAKCTNGFLQLPINLSKGKEAENIILQGPRRFSGKNYWQNQFLKLRSTPEGIFNQNSKGTWTGGPGDAVGPAMALEFGSIGEILESSITLLKNHWITICAEVGAAVKYLRHLWTTTNGNYSQKALVVNRMISFYLILLGIYIAESGFWVNQQLLQGLYSIVLKPKRNVDMLMGIGAVGIFIFLLYLIGGPPAASRGICTSAE